MTISRNREAPRFGWKHQESRHGPEYFHYPSDLARQLWLYPQSIGRARTPPHVPVPHTCADRYLLQYVERGDLWHRRDNRTVVARRGDACLMDMNREFTHGTDGPEPAVSYWVAFNGKDMDRCFLELGADADPVFTGLDASAFPRLFRDLMRLTKKEDAAYEWKAAGLLTLMLAELYAVRARTRPHVSLGAEATRYSEPVRKGIAWIVREYDTPYTVKELFQVVGYSRSYFSRLFRRETGLPPSVWMNRYRVDQARRLLANTRKSIAEIARAVGVPDQNYFARLFRQVAGTTARAYRRQEQPGAGARRRRRKKRETIAVKV